MRVIVVGSPAERERLRAQLNGLSVVAEATTLAEARMLDVEAEGIISPAPAADVPYDEPLTAREVQVLELLAEGLPNKAIAERLRISDQTVKFHVAAIAGKLGASNRTDAVRRAVRRGLITL